MTDRQTQKAGDNSNQYQANTIHVHNGISEERVHDIVDTGCEKAMQTCIMESRLNVERRLSEFKTELFASIGQRANLFDALQEPSCVGSLERAAKASTMSDEERDKKLLAELLVKRFEAPTDRHVATGVNKAIGIVEYLTDEELAGLTAYYAISAYSPSSGNVEDGIKALASVFDNFPLDLLPSGEDWIDVLDIHSALRVSPLSSLKPFMDFQFASLSGYTVCGIVADTDKDKEAISILKGAGVPATLYGNHELNPGHKRLFLRSTADFDDLRFVKATGAITTTFPATKQQREAVKNICEMSKSDECDDVIKGNLEHMIMAQPALAKVRKWWDAVPAAPTITAVGKVLADANARRLNPSLPEE